MTVQQFFDVRNVALTADESGCRAWEVVMVYDVAPLRQLNRRIGTGLRLRGGTRLRLRFGV
jgi:hypothetical protein